ncbi:MAG: hypothetical protein HFF15_04725 [Angelakisella sp.]|jgi:hypothetical protein|nr:hypothetical protein [Angelakisella sp.]
MSKSAFFLPDVILCTGSLLNYNQEIHILTAAPRLERKLHWVKEAKMAVVISQERNEVGISGCQQKIM